MDVLYVVNKDQVVIIPGEHGDVDMEIFRVEWKGNQYTAGDLSELFANKLDQTLRAEPPEGMKHNGYAAPRYSGIRVSGPAVTVLFRTATDIGPMKKGSMVSLDITLALPCSHLPWDQKEKMDAIDVWFTNYITSTNDKPIDAVEPHVIPCRITKIWKPTSAHIEANVLHELERHCALKKTHILLKCLMKKVDKFNCEHRLFHAELKESPARSQLIKLIECGKHLEENDRVNHCMRHGYILLSPDETDKHNELKKKSISINAAYAKQILFQRATREDYKPGCADQTRALTLMKEIVAEIANPETLHINNHIHHSFPPICKFSVREILSSQFHELASNLLHLYDKLISSISTLVSIDMFKKSSFALIKARRS